jgi:ribosome-associated protein
VGSTVPVLAHLVLVLAGPGPAAVPPHRLPGESLRVTASPTAVELALAAAQAAADKSAHDIRVLDVSEQLVITDCFVLASAPNERLVRAISDEVQDRLRERGVKPVRREGESEGRWVLLDFIDLVVHVQHAEERAFYQLERLWKDCPDILFSDAALAAAPAAAASADASVRPGDGS